MAVNKDKASGQQQGGGSQFAQAYEKAGGNQQQGQQQGGRDFNDNGPAFSFLNPNSFSSIPLARGQAAEVLVKLEKSVKETFEQINQAFEVTLIGLDWNNNQNLDVSTLIVAIRYKETPGNVAYVPLLLAGSVDAKEPVFVNLGGFNTEVTFVVGDAYNDKMFTLVRDEVARHFPQTNLYPCPAMTVDADFKVEDPAAVYNLSVNAALACSAELDQANPNFRDLNLKKAANDASLVVRPTFGRGQVMNALGQPVRADFTVTLNAEPIQQNQGNYAQNGQIPQSTGRSSTISQLTGFVDLVWSPQMPIANAYSQPMQQMYGQPQQMNFRRFLPRIVLTACTSRFGLTPASQLFALLTSTVLRQNNLWAQAFRRDSSVQTHGVDHRDIGAIGLECNFTTGGTDGVRIDTKAATFTDADREALIAALIVPTPLLSFDVEEAGADTWATGIYAAVAEGDPDAIAALIHAADQLYDGAFSRNFPVNGRLIVDELNRIHLGHYHDANGKMDMRTIDYLWVENQFGEKDPKVVQAFSDTFFDTAPLLKRLADRKSMIEKMVDRPVFTGYARRVTFTPECIEAMLKSCEETGLSMRTHVPYQDQNTHQRATGSFDGMAMGAMNSPLFNRFGQQQQAQGGFGGGRQFFSGKQW